MSTLFDSLSRRRLPGARRSGGGHATAGHDAVLASLGYRPRRGLHKAVKVLLLLAGGVAVLVAWAAWDINVRRPAAAQESGQPSAPVPPPTREIVPAPTPLVELPPAPVETPPALVETPAVIDVPVGDPLIPDTVPGPTGPPRAVPPEPLPVSAPEPIPPPPTPAPSGEPHRTATPAVDSMTVALYHHRTGDFERALVAYQSLLGQNELNAAVHNNLGLLYQEKNLLDEAARSFQRAIVIDARYALAHNNYGVTLLRQGRHDAAAAQFRKVLELQPRNVDAMINQGLAARAAGQREEARAVLLRALAESPRHALAHYNLAVLQDEAGEIARAIVHYRAYLEHVSGDDPERAAQVRARLGAIGSI